MGPVEFVLWEDESGRCYVQEFLDNPTYFSDIEADQIAQILEDYSLAEWLDLIRDEKVTEEENGLYCVHVDLKGKLVCFFGSLRNFKLMLVHAATKLRHRSLALGHYDEAKQRIKRIK